MPCNHMMINLSVRKKEDTLKAKYEQFQRKLEWDLQRIGSDLTKLKCRFETYLVEETKAVKELSPAFFDQYNQVSPKV